MKKRLLLLLVIFGTMLAAHGQQIKPFGALSRYSLPMQPPSPAFQPAAARGAVQANGSSQRYTRYVAYAWDNGRWSASPTIVTLTWNAAGNVAQAIQMDSATQFKQTLETYGYNANNQQTSYLRAIRVGRAWENATQSLTTYDSNGRLTQDLVQEWVAGAWVNVSAYQLAYDAQGNTTSYTVRDWNPTGVQTSGYRFDFMYDTQNRPALGIYSSWTTGNYFPYERYFYTYNGASNQYSTILTQALRTGNWEYTYRDSAFQYDRQDRITHVETEQWTGTAWDMHERTSVAYGVNGSGVRVNQMLISGTWVNTLRYSFFYDANSEDAGFSTEDWTGTGWRLVAGTRYLDAFDRAGNRVRRIAKNVADNAYVNAFKYYYGNYISIAIVMYPVDELPRQSLLYPNPTTGHTVFAVSGLREQGPIAATLTNTLGRVMQRLTLYPKQGAVEQPLELEGLPAGVYLLTMRAAEGTVVKRIVKQ